MNVTEKPLGFDPVENFEDFFRFYQDEPNKFKYREEIHDIYDANENTITFLYEDLMSYDPELAHELYVNPEKMLDAAVEAFQNLLRIEAGGAIDESQNYYIQITAQNNPLQASLNHLGAGDVNKLVLVEGVVMVQGTPMPVPQVSAFECPACGHQFLISQKGLLAGNLVMSEPEQCRNPGCRNKKNFQLLTNRSSYIDCQYVVLQGERLENFAECNVVLSRTLINKAILGDHINVVGIYRGPVRRQESRKGLVPSIPLISALSIQVKSKMPYANNFATDDLTQVSNLFTSLNLKDILVQSVAPQVDGLDLVKEAAILACISASGDPAGKDNFREELFVNILSEHEFECRKIIQFLHELIPFSRISGGSGTIAGGLMARVAGKWENLGTPFYAGPILQAKNSVVFLHDLKNIAKKEQEAFKELLGNQMISNVPPQVSPIHCKCAIIAVTSPKNGSYDPWKPFTDNISLPVEICSLFDISLVNNDLKERSDKKMTNPLPPDRLARYIASVRSLEVILPKDVILFLGQYSQSIEKPMDNTRLYLVHLNQVLARITIAYAKLHGHSTASTRDAEYAIELVKKSLMDLGIDNDTGPFDTDRFLTGHSREEKERANKVLEILKDMEEENGNKSVDLDALKERVALGGELKPEEIEEALKSLKREGDLIYPKNGLVKSVKH